MSSNSEFGIRHVLFCPAHMWGHIRPLSVLAARMVKLRPVSITLFVPKRHLDGAKAEISRELLGDAEGSTNRVRLVSLEQGEDMLDPAIYETHILEALKGLFNGELIPCEAVDGTRRTLNFVGAPLDAAVIDIVLIEAFNTLREQSRAAKLFSWLPVAINSVLALCRFDGIPIAEAAAAAWGVSFNEAARQLVLGPNGQIINSPCFPDMHDYEYQPQAFPMPADQCGRIYIRIGRVLQQTDGVLTFDAADYYPEATSVAREWLAETSRKIYYTGPLLPGIEDLPIQADENAQDAFAFLDRQVAEHGEHSVIYISFGSLFWPSDPAKVDTVLDVLVGRSIPFILTRPSPLTSLSAEIISKLARCSTAFVAEWVYQQAVLDHPAIGWCLTHGGHNTVLECILAGVPMIVWPIFTDQPLNAIHLAEHLDVAYELFEVRHGSGLGPILRTGRTPAGTLDSVREELVGVLGRAFGEDGEAKRARLRSLGEKLRGAWADGGIAQQEVEAFLDDLGSA